jgi:hypothetical protein
MGVLYNFKCTCGYSAEVCGGETGIRMGWLRTAWCKKCLKVYDKSTRVDGRNGELIREEGNIQVFKGRYGNYVLKEGQAYVIPNELKEVYVSNLKMEDFETIIAYCNEINNWRKRNKGKGTRKVLRQVEDIHVIIAQGSPYLRRGDKVYVLPKVLANHIPQLTKDDLDAIILHDEADDVIQEIKNRVSKLPKIENEKVIRYNTKSVPPEISVQTQRKIDDIVSRPNPVKRWDCEFCDDDLILWPSNHPCPKCGNEMKHDDRVIRVD